MSLCHDVLTALFFDGPSLARWSTTTLAFSWSRYSLYCRSTLLYSVANSLLFVNELRRHFDLTTCADNSNVLVDWVRRFASLDAHFLTGWTEDKKPLLQMNKPAPSRCCCLILQKCDHRSSAKCSPFYWRINYMNVSFYNTHFNVKVLNCVEKAHNEIFLFGSSTIFKHYFIFQCSCSR